ncbi:MAG: hypothetical protein J6S23_06325 [Clostridia bacterium]|nr:hypothetical protein [Clostridia bacterium]
MKTTARIILTVIVITLALSICGCTNVATISRDISRAVEFGENVISISKISDYNVAMEEAEKLVHPKSGLDKETIINMVKENEEIKSLNLKGITMADVKVGSFSTPEFKFNNEELGGNIYELHVVVTVAGNPLNVTLTLLSDDSGMGLYSFDIQNSQ